MIPAGVSVNGNNHTIFASDLTATTPFSGGVITVPPGETVAIQSLTISGQGFQLPTNCPSGGGPVVYGIWFNDSSGTVNNVTVEHIFQTQGQFASCNTGTAIRADGATAGRTLTITNTKVLDYQKNGIDGRGPITMDVSSSTIGPPHLLAGLIAQNGLLYFGGATGTASNNMIFGSGDQVPDSFPPAGGLTDGTAVLLYGAQNVTITHNILTSDPSTDPTDIGVSVTDFSTGNVISFNQIGRVKPPSSYADPTGHGIDVSDPLATKLSPGSVLGTPAVGGGLRAAAATDPPASNATLICNTFSNWKVNIVGAIQISCTPFPDPPCGQPYSSSVLTAEGGTLPYTWSAVGTLPPGLGISATTGTVSGTPTAAGAFPFTAHVVDSSTPPLTASQAASITVVGSCSEEAGENPAIPEADEPGEAAPVAPITTTGLAFTG
jgi:hypothetical protein